MQTLRFKAGDTFSLVGQLTLPVGHAWAGRGKIRRADGSAVDTLDVDISGDVEEYARLVSVTRDPDKTASWPKPAAPGDVEMLYADFEIYDDGDFTVMSSHTVRVIVEYDPTRN